MAVANEVVILAPAAEVIGQVSITWSAAVVAHSLSTEGLTSPHLLDLASVARTEACHRMVAGVFAQLEASMEEVHFERVVASEVQG